MVVRDRYVRVICRGLGRKSACGRTHLRLFRPSADQSMAVIVDQSGRDFGFDGGKARSREIRDVGGEYSLSGRHNAPYRQWLGTAWVVTGIGLASVTVNQPASGDLPGIGMRVGDFVIVEPERMLDGPFALGEYIDIGARLANGHWLVVLYRPDCPTCQSLLEELSAIHSEFNQRAQIAWICVGTAQRPEQSLGLTEAHPQWVLGAMSQRFDWFVSVPLFVALEENRVLAASSALEGSFRDLVNGSWPQDSKR